jgi:hypothetical protein
MKDETKSTSMEVGNIGETIALKLPIPDEDVSRDGTETHYFITFDLLGAREIARKLIEAIQKVESGEWKRDLQ